MIQEYILQIRNRTEFIVLAMMIMVIVMLIVPLPTYLVDFLIGINLTMALLIFLGSFYIVNILEFSTFPSILLISTIFRLAISISTSRLVLLNADAGNIITSFGQFVIGDNLVVGFVIFFIVTIVQFIVITKGSERIAEVAARFSLDAMPGKQMSIDADLRAGVIDEEELIRRRSDLEAESQLYGALDGAMKFIKGDAIAGIVIIFVNLIGGISVGVLQHKMNMSSALSIYAILTIGDALVAQIPALLISISGGLIVTRVNNSKGDNLGAKIVSDIFFHKSTLIITAILTIALGLLPGFPLPVFLILAAILLCVYLKHQFNEKKKRKEKKDTVGGDEYTPAAKPVVIDGEFIPETLPLIISAWSGHSEYFKESNFLSLLKRDFFIEYGVRLPNITINLSDSIDRNQFIIAINEIMVNSYTILPSMSKILMRGEELSIMNKNVQVINSSQGDSYWIPDHLVPNIQTMGYYTRSAVDEFYFCFSTLLVHNITEFFGIQETKILLDDLEKKYPDLLKECYRSNTIQKITEVFQRLLQERISIRNMRLILEALVQWSPKEKDPIMLVEHVRNTLSRYISNRFAHNDKIRAIILSHETENVIRESIRQTSSGTFINISPPEVEDIISRLNACINSNRVNPRDVVMITSMDIRRFVKKIIEGNYSEMEALSFSEITSNIDIDVVGTM